ncbi:major histocompatibility complex class I-related gene protein-like isoform X2 [Salvelinus fontinalis]|uniref:major histocompatibility complex class I-related gene protein-like isoform X2 n=1 Tax=Salvelinus fontinalis TaxID=8038 RepID=UPI0024861067|nr:major histocompatibility complex class I-related gene protein-like isoform X2 [Salvelinus fontinalis]
MYRPNLMFLVLYFSLECICRSQSDIYSLNYIYTALSKPLELPGIHEFTAMGLMNNRQIDYYDSVSKKKIPKQEWMREKLPADYWEKGTQSRKSKEQWFKVNVNILMDRMRHNNTDLHILQWKHGCEIDQQSDGTLKFIKGTDQYSYDGDDFLAFDDVTMQWVAPVDQALPTKRKWDGVQILNQYTKGYLEKECVDWLSKFMEYGHNKFSRADSPPKVYVFAKKAKTAGHVRLTCMATGFYPKDVLIHIKKNGVTLTKHDGVQSTGVLPNDDDTYQIRMSVQIPEADKETYECSVSHRSLKEPIVGKWDGECCDCSSFGAVVIGTVIAIIVVLILVSVVLFVLHRRGTIVIPGLRTTDDESRTSSDSGKGSQNEGSSDIGSEEDVKKSMLPKGSG